MSYCLLGGRIGGMTALSGAQMLTSCHAGVLVLDNPQ